MTKRVTVLCGGTSVEREVSLVSGEACTAALTEAGYDAAILDTRRPLDELVAALTPAPDVVFNALHGRIGEDGRIQGVLDLLAIPYTHSGVLASALAMNKVVAKKLFANVGIPSPEGVVGTRREIEGKGAVPPPCVIKPIAEGSSIGVRIVRQGENLSVEDWPHEEEVLVERYIPGREITVAVMNDQALGVTELVTEDGFYDYEAKYTEGATTHFCPAPISDSIADAAMNYALEAHRVLGCRGVSRADFRYDDQEDSLGGLFILEVNTQPGMTPLSLVPEQAAVLGIGFPELVAWMVENAACDT